MFEKGLVLFSGFRGRNSRGQNNDFSEISIPTGNITIDGKLRSTSR
jgi:hypothetical protein